MLLIDSLVRKMQYEVLVIFYILLQVAALNRVETLEVAQQSI